MNLSLLGHWHVNKINFHFFGVLPHIIRNTKKYCFVLIKLKVFVFCLNKRILWINFFFLLLYTYSSVQGYQTYNQWARSSELLNYIWIFFFLLLVSFSNQPYLMVYKRNLSDSKLPQVPWTHLSILADLNNDVDWIVSIHPSISYSSSPLSKPLRNVPSASITIFTIIEFNSNFKIFC